MEQLILNGFGGDLDAALCLQKLRLCTNEVFASTVHMPYFLSSIGSGAPSRYTLPIGEGFGFNGNILETNVLNLGVVLAIVFVVGGDSLTSTLDERKQSIAKNLERAEQRAKEAKEKLFVAQSQLEAAQKKAAEILEQGKISADKEKKDSARKKEEEISRLTKKKEEILYLEEEKAFFQVYEKFVNRIIEKTKERLLTRLNSQTHTSVINSQISLISKCKQ